MPWPWRRRLRRGLARIAIEGPIAGPTRVRVLKALEQVKQRGCPALLLRIDSPGGTVGDSQEIHAAILRLRESGCRVVASSRQRASCRLASSWDPGSQRVSFLEGFPKVIGLVFSGSRPASSAANRRAVSSSPS